MSHSVADAALLIVALMVLAVVDGAFAGFRAGAGRTSLVRPWRRGYYPRFVVAGGLTSLACQVPAAVSGAVGVDVTAAADVAAVVAAATAIGEVAGLYAAVVIAAIVIWVLAGIEGRTLVSVIVLGPFTLLRPFVVLAAMLRAISVGTPGVALTFALGCAGVLVVEPIVSALQRFIVKP
jgi:hypothetical protein